MKIDTKSAVDIFGLIKNGGASAKSLPIGEGQLKSGVTKMPFLRYGINIRMVFSNYCYYLRLLGIFWFISTNTAQANICDSVLTVFNKSDFSTDLSMASSMYSEMCIVKWDNFERFRNQAASANIPLPQAQRIFGINASSSSNVVQQKFYQYCSMDEEEFSLDYQNRFSIVESTPAINAWNNCVRHYFARHDEGIFATISQSPNLDEFIISLEYRTRGNARAYIKSWNSSEDVECYDGAQSIPRNPDDDGLTLPSGNSGLIRCIKSAEDTRVIGFNTSVGSLPVFTLPGTVLTETDKEEILTRIRNEQNRLTELRTEVRDIERKRERQALRVESGRFSHANWYPNHNMWTGQRSTLSEGVRHVDGRIRFSNSFSSDPQVVLGLSTIDIGNDNAARLRIHLVKVDREGFDFQIRTWGGTRIARAWFNWMAVGKP